MADSREFFKMDVGYFDNPKVQSIIDTNPQAVLLHMRCIAYARQHRTDGLVPLRVALRSIGADASGIATGNASGNAEKRREEKSNKRSSADADDAFRTWWQHYPRKVSKGTAERAYRAAAKKADEATLLTAVQQFAATISGTDPKFVPHAATWLNGERWADIPPVTPEQPRELSPIYESDMRPFDGDPDDVQGWAAHQRAERARIRRERGEVA